MNVQRLPFGAQILRILDQATQGEFIDFIRLCSQNEWDGNFVIDRNASRTGVRLHLHAANKRGRTAHFESHRLQGDAATVASRLAVFEELQQMP